MVGDYPINLNFMGDNIMTTATELKRANRVTAYWSGSDVACGIFYKTHEKIIMIQSTDAAVITAGFVMPESTDETPVNASQKLEAFKTFLTTNATLFGVVYDPVDRRVDEFKFPNKYNEELFKEYADKVFHMTIGNLVASVNKGVIAKLVANEVMPIDSVLQYGVGNPELVVTELYPSGSIKYANIKFPLVFAVHPNITQQVSATLNINMISGQIKKPTVINEDVVMTMTGIKEFLIANGLLPKVERKKKKEVAEVAEVAETVEA